MLFCVGLVSMHWFWLGQGTRRAQIRAGGHQHQVVALTCFVSVACEAASLSKTAAIVVRDPAHVVRLHQYVACLPFGSNVRSDS